MNYQKIYNSIIKNAQNLATERITQKYLEKHHIVPRSIGGSNEKGNIVLLTTREHFICHRLLVKITKNNPAWHKKMIYALWWMVKTRNNMNNNKITSRTYCIARKLYIDNHPNRCEIRKQKFKENYQLGKYNYNYAQVSTTLKKTLSKISKEDMKNRMKRSAGSCDHSKRGNSIKKGKQSILLLTKVSGEKIQFYSHDDVKSITGFNYNHIKYRIKRYNGLLSNGDTVNYILKYTQYNLPNKRNSKKRK